MRNALLSCVVVSGFVAATALGPAHAESRAAKRGATIAALDAPVDTGAAIHARRGAARSSRAQLTGERGITTTSALHHSDAPNVSTDAAPTRPAAFLEADDVLAHVAPHSEALERCYLTHITGARRAGHLDILLEIARNGRVLSVATAAGELSPHATRRVTACIRAITQAVQFPQRRNDTTVVLPYYFQKTDAPGAGPQPSCWNAQGCR